MSAAKAKPRVLFVTYGGGHVSMVIPVAQKLVQMDAAHVVVLGLTTAAQAVKKADLPLLQFKDFIVPTDAAAIAWGSELLLDLPESSLVDREESCAYLGLCFSDLVEQHGLKQAREMYAQYGRYSFSPTRTMIRILSEVRPDIVVITNSPRAEQASGYAAARLGIPAICINSLFAIDEIEWIGKPDFCQKVCVLNEAIKSKLILAGRNPADIVVTGNPSFDALALPKMKNAGIDLRAHLAREKTFVVLWASQPEPLSHPTAPGKVGDEGLPDKICHQIVEWSNQKEDRYALIRPHPNEYWVQKKYQNAKLCPSPQYDISELLHASDLVITMTSTVGVQAYSLGLPVVQVRGSIFDHSMPLHDYSMAQECNLHNLGAAIDRGLSTKLHLDLAIDKDIQATTKVVDEILRLA